MTNRLLSWISNRRSLLLIVAILLAIVALATVAGVLWHRSRSRTTGETIPALVDTSAAGRGGAPGFERAAADRGDGAVTEAGGGPLRIGLSPGQAESQAAEPAQARQPAAWPTSAAPPCRWAPQMGLGAPAASDDPIGPCTANVRRATNGSPGTTGEDL